MGQGGAQRPGIWFQRELPDAVTVTEVELDSAAPGSPGSDALGSDPTLRWESDPNPGWCRRSDPNRRGPPMRSRGQTPKRTPKRCGFGLPSARGPVAYTLQLSMDGITWGTPVAQGAGEAPTTVIPFAAAQARFLRITQTGTAANGELWGIQQVRLYGRSGH